MKFEVVIHTHKNIYVDVFILFYSFTPDLLLPDISLFFLLFNIFSYNLFYSSWNSTLIKVFGCCQNDKKSLMFICLFDRKWFYSSSLLIFTNFIKYKKTFCLISYILLLNCFLCIIFCISCFYYLVSNVLLFSEQS